MQPIACMGVAIYAHYAQKYWFKRVFSTRLNVHIDHGRRDRRNLHIANNEAVADAQLVDVVEGRRVENDVISIDEEARIFERMITRLVELGERDIREIPISTLAEATGSVRRVAV